MAITTTIALKLLKEPKYWLLGIATCSIAVHLTLTWRAGDVALLSGSILFWSAASLLVWEKRDDLNLESGVFSSLLGICLILLVFLRSISLPTSNFLGASPFITAVGLSLLASGFRGLKQYWRELTIVFFLGIPEVILWPIIDISAMTAKYATLVLWYLGFDASWQGINVVLPTGAVEVNRGCSGSTSIFYLSGLAVLFLVMFPISGAKRFFVPLVAIFLAFAINGFRVALMAIFAAARDEATLDYWHIGDGSHIFSLISVLIFGLFYFFLLQREGAKDS
ncbi:MAG: cyanoexosortase A [Cyanosarcina radialis HA8281-LM2]|jgi:cyanoexosortase A|nr:cyanoexosortase A [Cyanosarcina radialis HA8281-LM2]